MGSLGRQFNRVEAKKYYKLFCKDWVREKLKRRTTVSGESGDKVEAQLGKRPSFNQWLQAVNKQMADAISNKLKKIEDEKNSIDTEWKEEIVESK